MDTIQIIEGIISTKYSELQSYTDLFNVKSTKDRDKIIKSKEIYEEHPGDVDLSTLSRDVLYINGFHQLDIRKMQESLLNTYKVFKEAGGTDENFSEEFLRTIEIIKQGLTKQFFITDKNKFVEIEIGRLEKSIQDYEEKGYYKLFEKQIKKLVTQ